MCLFFLSLLYTATVMPLQVSKYCSVRYSLGFGSLLRLFEACVQACRHASLSRSWNGKQNPYTRAPRARCVWTDDTSPQPSGSAHLLPTISLLRYDSDAATVRLDHHAVIIETRQYLAAVRTLMLARATQFAFSPIGQCRALNTIPADLAVDLFFVVCFLFNEERTHALTHARTHTRKHESIYLNVSLACLWSWCNNSLLLRSWTWFTTSSLDHTSMEGRWRRDRVSRFCGHIDGPASSREYSRTLSWLERNELGGGAYW